MVLRMSSSMSAGCFATKETAAPALAETYSSEPIGAGAASQEAMPCLGPLNSKVIRLSSWLEDSLRAAIKYFMSLKPLFCCDLRDLQDIGKMILQIILQSRLPHFG